MAVILQFTMVRVFYILQQGNLLRSIDNKIVRRLGISICLHMFSSQKHTVYKGTHWFKIAVLELNRTIFFVIFLPMASFWVTSFMLLS
jgi:hypothetical protein